MARRLTAVGLLALAAACGSGDDDGPPGVFADAAGVPDAAAPIDAQRDPDGPSVAVLFPAASADLDSDSIVTSERFTARCRAAPNVDTGTPVDSASVRFVLFGAGGVTRQQPALATPTVNEYEADVSVADFANGPLSVRCVASDTSQPANTNSAENDTYLDLGPAIMVFTPVPGTFYAEQVEVVFRVDPARLTAADDGADVDTGSIGLSVAGEEVDVEGPDPGGVYTATVDFDDPSFVPPLDGEQTLTFTAQNRRTPDPVTRTLRVVFNADADGPVVTIAAPLPGELIGGIFTVTTTITDPAGVNPLSVVATLAHDFEFPLVDTGGGVFSASFDSRALAESWVFPLLEVRAKDAVGNQSSIGQLLALDNRPPIAALDPPQLREAFINDETGLLACSDKFDPLGVDAVNDGQTVAQLSEIRTRIEDRGNGATFTSDIVIPIAGIDGSTVQLFVQDVTDGLPLLVDNDDDGECDEINPAITPTSVPMTATEAAVVDLVAIGPEGAPRYSNPPQPAFEVDETHPESECNIGEGNAPGALCPATSPLTRVIKAEIGDVAAIYGIPPITGLACLGNPFDSAASNISDGWACLAVRAVDGLGNIGVSPPMRVCFDADGDGDAGCGAWGDIAPEGSRPRCTDGCALPYSFADDAEWQLRRSDL
jgi:hypothetical protein